jgi:Cu-Zn family superoxide dismutase
MKKLALIAIAISSLVLVSCRSGRGAMAMASLNPSEGNAAKGMVHFQDQGDGSVEVVVDLTGVPPGVHGFHVHDKGDCGNNGQNAGAHFNPMNLAHGAPDAQSHHAGDFGNVTADANGEIHTRFMTHSITVKDGASSVVGRSVVLHGNPDDLVSQPAGNAGPRIGCGIVVVMSGDHMAGSMHH